MEKVKKPDEKLEFQFCIEVNEGYNRTTKSVYMSEAGEYYLVNKLGGIGDGRCTGDQRRTDA